MLELSRDGLEGGDEGWPEIRPRAIVSGTLYVNKKYRRQGLAQRLLREAEVQARLSGVDEMLLLVDQNNAPALKLYKKMGYHARGAVTEFHRGQVCMAKHLYFPTPSNIASIMPFKFDFVKMGA